MIDFLAGLLVGAGLGYYIGRYRGWQLGQQCGNTSALLYAKRKAHEAGWPSQTDRD
jgi:membrane protein DedA with SNARE-associated domain